MGCERSLIVLKNYLGDTVMASPLVRCVCESSRETHILGSPATEQLLRFPNFVASFSDPGKLSNVSNLFKQGRRLRSMDIDMGYLVNRSFRSALLLRLAGVKRRIGHSTEGRAWLLTDRIPYDLERNEAESYLDLARVAGIPITHVEPQLSVSPEELEEGSRLVQGATVGFQLGARHDYKQIPIAIWREFARSISARGCKIALLGGSEEASLVQESGIEGTNLVGATSIRQTMAALANLKLMIGGDTGVMHIAAAVGTPTITAFGPTPARKWGWFREPHQVILAQGGDIAKLDADTLIQAAEKILCGQS